MNEVRDAQCRMLLSDNAASMGRLAAALSHELNNPLGVLKSNLDTLRTLVLEKPGIPEEKRKTLAEMKATLCQNSQESVERLQSTVARMQRFTNLDRAEEMPVDLNSLLRDVSDVVGDALDEPAEFDLRLAVLPDVEVRPQQMTAVFSALLQRAAESAPAGSPVRVTTALDERNALVRIEDEGPGMSEEELKQVLDPTFAVRDGRVAACNWSLFGARQIVRQHGGEIDIRATPGSGAAVEVRLPLSRA